MLPSFQPKSKRAWRRAGSANRLAQGKSNYEASVILGISAATVKKHLENIYGKLGVEGRNPATLRALEVLSTRT